MTKPLRLLAMAAAVNGTLGLGVAAAQTVLVKNAPPGAKVEVALNAATVATETAGPTGEATLAFTLPVKDGKAEIDANVFVDVCDKVRRVIVVERGTPPLALEADCERKEIQGLFWVRSINTLVVDVGGANPSLLLINGSYHPPRRRPAGEGGEEGARIWTPVPKGLALFGGAGLAEFSDAAAIACGNVTPCSGDGARFTYSAGGTFWITRFLGAEAGYMKPRKLTTKGSGSTFKFTNTLDAQLVTIAGKVGAPIGPTRLYGLAGVNYHQATSSTSETIDIATQTFDSKTDGWGWLFGGGLEAWVAPKVAIYGETGLVRLKGAALNGGQGPMDDHLRFIVAGARVRLGR